MPPIVKFKKLHPNAKLPTYAKPGDAGMDLYACLDEKILVNPGHTKLIPTGLAMELPEGYEAQIRPRSGLAKDNNITVINSPGTVDFGYRGPIGILVINHHPCTGKYIESGMRVAQMVVKPVEQSIIVEVEELSDSDRGEGGFGSTGF